MIRGAAKLSGLIDTLVSNFNQALEIMHSYDNVSKTNCVVSSIAAPMNIMCRMVDEGYLQKGVEL